MAKSMKPKKKPNVKPRIERPYHVRTGTRNELGPVRTYQTEAQARNAIILEFDSFKPWCARHHGAGINALDAAIAELGRTAFHQNPGRIEANFDDLYEMWMVVEFWRTP